MKKSKRILSLLLLWAMLLPMLPVLPLPTFAVGTDAMEEIEADGALSAYKQGETLKESNDGYIGIPYEVTVYYDYATHGKAKAGYMTKGATPVMMYVVNANFERVGTDSDASIIKSMLARGYVVVVVDYLNNERAKSPDLDWSTQKLRNKAKKGDYFKDSTVFESGEYDDTLTVPSGYNVRLNDVYFELDKHGVDGTLEEIVKLWNNDFRGTMGSKIVKWVRKDGTRKATQSGTDGSSPVWYADAAGSTVDNANGQYTKVTYTKATVITDCVKPDGSPIDLNLYMHTLYPTDPAKDAPGMILFSSSASLSAALNNEARPQFAGFLFGGYACAIAEYAYIPMARSDHYGTFSGDMSGGATGVNMTYATYTYNATQSASAAVRMLRYLALAEDYPIDVDHVGAYGISKTAWYTQLGAPALRNDLIVKADGLTDLEVAQHVNDKINSFVQLLLPVQSSGRTRYDNGITEAYTVDGFTVDGGELQPWAVYDGNEISSGVQANYSSCGAFLNYFTEGYAPQFITENLQDTSNTEYGQQNIMVNLCRTMNIPSLWFEAELAHTFAEGPDYNYGVDTYAAFFNFMAYYLKNGAVSVCYTNPVSGSVIDTTDGITVKFIGEVSATEIEKVTVSDSEDNVLTGRWTSAYGNTEWTFLADHMKGATAYTLTVPATLTGSNGVAMGKAYTASFYTRGEGAVASLNGAATLNSSGTTVSLTVPEKTADGYAIRVNVKNDAANTLYAYNAANGELMGSVRVAGAGFHEIDVTDYLASYAVGTELAVTLKTAKAESLEAHYHSTFDSDSGDLGFKNSEFTVGQEIDGALALKIVRATDNRSGEYSVYPNMENAYTFSTNKLIKNGAAVSKADLGRIFLITIRVYDTVSRPIHMYMNSATQRTTQRIDHDRVYYNFFTTANEWCEFTIPYTVYEMKYAWKTQVKDLFVQFTPLGGKDKHPIYLDDLKVEEVFTDLDVSSISIVCASDSGKGVQAPVSKNPFKIGSTEYATWKAAMNAATSGATVTMQRNYTLTQSDVVKLGGKGTLTIDLGGYRLTTTNVYDAPLWMDANNANTANVTLKNGSVILGDTPLVGHGSSTAAGSGKVVNVNVENVYLTVAEHSDMLTVINSGSLENATGVESNLCFTDSVIDVEREHLPERKQNGGVTVLHSGDANLKVRYTFTGGVIKMNNFHEVTFCESIVKANANAKGEYLKVLIPTGVTVPKMSLKKDSTYASLVSGGTENGYTVYNVTDAAYSTDYGAVPSEYADGTVYPFAIFMDEAFINGAKTWKEALTLTRASLEQKPGGTVQILMRGDRSVTEYIGGANWLCYMNGTVVLDLDGNTLHAKSASLFEAGVDASYKGSFDTTLTVKNGNVFMGNNNICGVQNNTTYAKNFDISFENVTFSVDTETFDGSKRKNLFYAQNNCKAQVNIDLTLTDCTVDLRGITTNYTVFNYYTSNDLVAANVRFIGGALIENCLGNITWYTADATDSILFEKGSNGLYPTLSVPNGTVPSVTLPTADGVFGFGEQVSDGADRDVYTLKNDTVSTPYGAVPAASAEKVFVIFMNGNFLAGKDTWKDTLTFVRETLTANAGASVQIMMQKNRAVTSYVGNANWLCYMNGSILLDLNGKTLSASTTSLFETGCDANYTGDFKTTLTVKNGTVLQGKGNVCGVQNSSSKAKVFDMTFEDVIFGIDSNFAEGNKATLFYAQNNCKSAVDMTLTLTDCTLDLRGIGRAYTVFSYATGTALVPVNITVNGGAILADSLDSITLVTVDTSDDTFVWGKGENDGFTTLTLPADQSLPSATTGSGVTADGTYVAFDSGVTSGDYKTYTLVENLLVTKYGNIPEANADKNAYPLVMFDGNKNFISGQPTWGSAITAAKNYLSSRSGQTVYILMRTDHNAGTSSAALLGLLVGTIEVDLGGHTLTRGNNSMLEAGTNGMTEAMSKQTATVNIRNGRILAGKAGSSNGHLVTYQSHVNYNKTINITFEDVTFGVTKGITSITSLITRSWGASSGVTGVTTSTLTLRNCVLDFTGSEGTNVPASTTVIHTSGSGTAQNIAVVIEGGSFKGKHSGITLTNVDGTDSVTFLKDANGSYFEFDLTAGTPSSAEVKTDRGTMYFAKKSGNIYTLAVKASECGNALIPYEIYDDTKNYAFILYVEGKLVASVSNWKAAQEAAKNYLTSNAGGTVYVLMRAEQSNGNWFQSDGVFNGTVVLDLGGNIMHRGANSFLELCTSGLNETQCGFVSNVVIRNGTLLAGKSTNDNGHIVAIQSNGNYNKTFNVTFENVTFGISKEYYNAEKNIFAVVVRDNGTVSGATGVVTANLLFDGCTFDFTDGENTVVPVKDTTVFYTNPSTARNNVDIKIKGGVYTGTHQKITFLNAGDKTTLTYLPDDDGEYFRFELTAGTPKAGAVTTDKGDGYFYKDATSGNYLLGIGRAAFTGASVQLGKDLSILYYVRIHDATLAGDGALAMTFTVNGKSVTVDVYETKNGEYVFALTGIAPQQMADAIDAVFTVGGKEIVIHSDYSIKQNLLNLLAKDAHTLGISAEKYAAMKTLIADLLLYGDAAQDYRDYGDTPILDGTEELAGSDATPDASDAMLLTGNENPKICFKSATVHFDTVNEIRIKLIASVADASLVTVTVDGTAYALTDLEALGGDCYRVTLDEILATALDTVHTVTLSYDGTEVASLSYSVNAYAYAILQSGSAEMQTLALALYRYGVSADAYASIA